MQAAAASDNSGAVRIGTNSQWLGAATFIFTRVLQCKHGRIEPILHALQMLNKM